MKDVVRIILVQVFLGFICLLAALFMVFVYAPQEGLELNLLTVWGTLFIGFVGAEIFLAICAVFYIFVWAPLFLWRDDKGNIIWGAD